MYSCECCSRVFDNINGLTKHMIQHNKSCFDFYINKYGNREIFPWKKFSDSSQTRFIECEVCGKRVSISGINNKRGISHHVLQHSKNCLSGYILKYGNDRTKWPEKTFLNIKICIDCGSVLKDPRSKVYCLKCRTTKHNVMKNPEVIKKNVETNKPIKESFKFKEILSRKAKEKYKTNPKYAEDQRNYMLNGGAVYASSFNTNPSKPQVELYNRIKELYPSAVLNFPIYEVNRSIDIVIPEHKIAIESDGSYWHQNKEKDQKRQEELEKLGWNFLRYKVDYLKDVPTKEQIENDINRRKSNV